MAARTRVKVDKDKLVEAIKARKEEFISKHKADRESAKAANAEYQMKTVDRLEKAIEAVKKGKAVFTGYGDSGATKHKLVLPERKTVSKEKPDTSRYDRDIEILEMSPEEVISLSTEDFERYVR